MNGYVDLHTHTTMSDGSYTPRELIRYAKEKGLVGIGVTDHDTIDGIYEALDEGEKIGIEVIPGIEMSINAKDEIHLLGYFKKNNFNNAKDILKKLLEARNKRNPKIINKLNELDINITMEDVQNEVKGNVIGRPHIASTLLKKGYVKTRNEAFDRYLGDGCVAYFPKVRFTPEEGIKEVLAAGGLPVLAHPIHLKMNNAKLEETIKTLKSHGLIGMEVFYVDNTNDFTGFTSRLAIKYDLVPTGGSDFHGKYKEGIDLAVGRGNLKVPYEVLDRLKSKF